MNNEEIVNKIKKLNFNNPFDAFKLYFYKKQLVKNNNTIIEKLKGEK